VTPQPDATAAPSVDFFAGLQSYHYQMQVSGDSATSVTIKGSVVAPDSIQMDFYLSESDTPVNSIIIIGDKAWSKSSASGQWESIDVAEAEGEISGLMPKDFWGQFPMDEIVGVSSDLGEETVNGVQAHHFQIKDANAETMSKLAEISGPASQGPSRQFLHGPLRADDGGWPVKALINASYPAGTDISQASITWEVSDVNSSAVSIQLPA
jgi:hypothetical protein